LLNALVKKAKVWQTTSLLIVQFTENKVIQHSAKGLTSIKLKIRLFLKINGFVFFG